MTEPLLTINNLKVAYTSKHGLIRAVDGIDLELRAGEVLGLVGESGCGKSTTARALMGLVPHESGQIRFSGQDMGAQSAKQWKHIRRDMQMVFQDPYASLNPRMTAGDCIAEPLRNHGLAKRKQALAQAAELMQQVGLNPDMINRYPHEFSGGQRQRIGIARALALKPKILICDEPVSALDVSVQAQIVNLLLELRDKLGLSLIIIAHDLAVVRHCADRLAVMYLGRIVEIGACDVVFDAPRHPYTQALLAAVPIPDPIRERQRQQVPLPGDPPSPEQRPAGCAFHPRCNKAIATCKTKDPELENGCACPVVNQSAHGSINAGL